MKEIDLKVTDGTKKYLKARATGNHKTWKDLLGNNEAIKDFSRIWDKRGGELRIMLAKIEYDFIALNDCSRDDIAAMKATLGQVSIAIQNCDNEYQLYLSQQAEKKNLEKQK